MICKCFVDVIETICYLSMRMHIYVYVGDFHVDIIVCTQQKEFHRDIPMNTIDGLLSI